MTMPTHNDVIESLAEQNAELRRQIAAIRALLPSADEVVSGTGARILLQRIAALAATQEGTDDHADTD